MLPVTGENVYEHRFRRILYVSSSAVFQPVHVHQVAIELYRMYVWYSVCISNALYVHTCILNMKSIHTCVRDKL